MIRVAIAADSAVVRAGLEALLRAEDIEVVGRAAGLEDLAAISPELNADVIVADLDDVGEEFPPEWTASSGLTGLPVVLLADPPPPDWSAETLHGPVRAILPRQVSAAELAGAVQAASAGLVALHPQFLDPLIARAEGASHEAPSMAQGESLSPRELEVLRMLADGLGNKIIAYRLGISEHTVKFHVASIMAKLRAGSRTEAVTLGIRRGLIMI